MCQPIRIIGIGNHYRRDDGAGLALLHGLRQALSERELAAVQLLEHDGEGASLLAAWQGVQTVLLLDAVATGAAPGTLVRFDASTVPLPPWQHPTSSHAFGVAEALELARALGQLPARLLLFGIEGHDFGYGDGLSSVVAATIPRAVAQVAQEVAALCEATSGQET